MKPYRNCSIGLMDRDSQAIEYKSTVLAREISQTSQEMQLNTEQNKKMLEQYKVKILEAEKALEKPKGGVVIKKMKRPNFDSIQLYQKKSEI